MSKTYVICEIIIGFADTTWQTMLQFNDVQLYMGITVRMYLTAVFFETGAMSTPTKSRNVTNCGSGGLF